jgi:hypothetical protein
VITLYPAPHTGALILHHFGGSRRRVLTALNGRSQPSNVMVSVIIAKIIYVIVPIAPVSVASIARIPTACQWNS